ncbi:MAG TPA: hypothetical protein VGP47_09300 [Parachlamydiaceae bacterium]|nr:hypothetical protein [Parachlamydiaceae bacterium]
MNFSVNGGQGPVNVGQDPLEATGTQPGSTSVETLKDRLLDNNVTGKQQVDKPPSFRSEAVSFARKACGLSLIAMGSVGAVVLSPIALPLGMLGLGLGAAAGKLAGMGYEKIMDTKLSDDQKKEAVNIGAFVGASLGSFLTVGLIGVGIKLAGAEPKSPQKDTEVVKNSEIPVEKQIIDLNTLKSNVELTNSEIADQSMSGAESTEIERPKTQTEIEIANLRTKYAELNVEYQSDKNNYLHYSELAKGKKLNEVEKEYYELFAKDANTKMQGSLFKLEEISKEVSKLERNNITQQISKMSLESLNDKKEWLEKDLVRHVGKVELIKDIKFTLLQVENAIGALKSQNNTEQPNVNQQDI